MSSDQDRQDRYDLLFAELASTKTLLGKALDACAWAKQEANDLRTDLRHSRKLEATVRAKAVSQAAVIDDLRASVSRLAYRIHSPASNPVDTQAPDARPTAPSPVWVGRVEGGPR